MSASSSQVTDTSVVEDTPFPTGETGAVTINASTAIGGVSHSSTCVSGAVTINASKRPVVVALNCESDSDDDDDDEEEEEPSVDAVLSALRECVTVINDLNKSAGVEMARAALGAAMQSYGTSAMLHKKPTQPFCITNLADSMSTAELLKTFFKEHAEPIAQGVPKDKIKHGLESETDCDELRLFYLLPVNFVHELTLS